MTAEGLDKLAAEAAAAPLLAADRELPEKVEFPGANGAWFKPRAIGAEGIMRYREVRVRPRWRGNVEDVRNTDEQVVETQLSELEPYLVLCEEGIEEIFIPATETRPKVHARRRGAGKAAIREVVQKLDIRHARWLRAWLLIHNGLENEAERVLGKSSELVIESDTIPTPKQTDG